jgi:hypothetical protein
MKGIPERVPEEIEGAYDKCELYSQIIKLV